jgi:hypothetical protein
MTNTPMRTLTMIGALAVLAACGTSNDNRSVSNRASEPPVWTSTASASPTKTPRPRASSSTSAAPTTTADAEITALKEYMASNFTGTSWYGYIKTIEAQAGAAWVTTTLVKDADATEPARKICAAVSGFVFDNRPKALHGVSVRAVDGQRLVLRTSLSQPC